MKTRHDNLFASLFLALATLFALPAFAAEQGDKAEPSIDTLHQRAAKIAARSTSLAENYADALARMAKSKTNESMTAIGQEIVTLEKALKIEQREMAKAMKAIARATASQTEATAERAEYAGKSFLKDMRRNSDETAKKLDRMKDQVVKGTAVATHQTLKDAEREFAEFNKELDALAKAGDEATDDLKHGVQDAWDELAQATLEAEQAFEQGPATN